MKKLTFFFFIRENISIFAPLKTKKKKKDNEADIQHQPTKHYYSTGKSGGK
ncbi:MAG: hypothetical protein IJX44_07280 [Bacteroidaceae bacterium]|nr:hypothetical protein [Bacteroidaceae bacterium]